MFTGIIPVFFQEAAISSIIIDGYNLTGTAHRDLQKEREELTRKLIAYRRLKGHDITIVFDGWKSGGRSEEHASTGGVRIIYSRLAEKADAVIKRIVSGREKEWIVVTSDREIADHAWKCGSVPVASDRFARLLEQALEDRSLREALPDEDRDGKHRKGSPRQLSRREKALARALGKL